MRTSYTKWILVAMISLSLPALSFAQCCDFVNSGQDLGTSPTFGVALGDLDGDGDLDAFTIDAYEDMEIYFNDGTGIYSLNQTITPAMDEEDNFGVHLADVDADLDLDAVVIPFYNSASLKIYKNNGAGYFTLFQTVSSNLGSRYAAVVDLDGDNDKDVFLPGGMSSVSKVFKNNGNGLFTLFSSITLANFGQANNIAHGDFDGDGDVDVALVTDMSGGRLLLNDGSGNFSDPNQILGNPDHDYYTAAAGDLDKDGDLDLVFGCMYDSLTVLSNDGTGSFFLFGLYPSSNYDKHMKILDYDGDTDLDVFVSTYGSYGLELWTNDGEGFLTLCYQNASPMPGTYSHGFDIGLIDGDGYYDAFMGEFGGDGDKVFFGNPGFSVQYVTATICEGDTYALPGGMVVNAPGTYTDNLLSTAGCDSVIITNLIVIMVNEAVTQNLQTLTAQASGASYQWLDCNNAYAPVPNATAQSFTPTQSGSYAVEVTENGCSDTSSCYPVVVTGLPGDPPGKVLIYPNPAGDLVRIDLTAASGECLVSLADYSGRVLTETRTAPKGPVELDLSGWVPGLYLVRITDPTGNTFSMKLLKL